MSIAAARSGREGRRRVAGWEQEEMGMGRRRWLLGLVGVAAVAGAASAAVAGNGTEPVGLAAGGEAAAEEEDADASSPPLYLALGGTAAAVAVLAVVALTAVAVRRARRPSEPSAETERWMDEGMASFASPRFSHMKTPLPAARPSALTTSRPSPRPRR